MNEYQMENIIKNIISEPITALLLKNCNLTGIQFETFLIDVLTDILCENEINFEKKTTFRGIKVSRGSFSRSLQQARKKIVSSMFTLLLLIYLGLFENLPIEEYNILAEKLKSYSEIIKNSDQKHYRILLNSLEKELLKGIENLSKVKNMKNL